jgi:16S rRNA processing protein RimM
MSADDIAPDDVIVVGRVGSPYGVKGWVHLHSFTSPAENILDYRPWLIKAKGGQWRTLTEVVCQRHKQGFIAHVEQATDREAAAGLTGQWIGVLAQALPDLDDTDEYYWRELIGARVVDAAGVELGRVDHLLETGAHDVLVVKDAQHPKREVLIPFIAQYVLRVDRDAHIITVDWDSDW